MAQGDHDEDDGRNGDERDDREVDQDRPPRGNGWYNRQVTVAFVGSHALSCRLRPGTYRWYVWPGFGLRSAKRYGKLIGTRAFVVAAR